MISDYMKELYDKYDQEEIVGGMSNCTDVGCPDCAYLKELLKKFPTDLVFE